MNGPIFVSHASPDGAEANELALALRQAFGQRVRTFNTSSRAAIQAGDLQERISNDLTIKEAGIWVANKMGVHNC
jgi:hypothetical protein